MALVKNGLANFLYGSTQSSSYFRLSIPANFSERDLLANGILIIYLSLLVIKLLKAVTGLSNPFVNNLYDTNFQILIPVNPFVSYYSVKLQNSLKNVIMVSLICIGLFGPYFFLFSIPYTRLFLIFLNYYLGLEFISIIGDIIFFLSNKIRSGKNWILIFTEKNNIIVMITSLIVPVIFILLFDSNIAWTYQKLTEFSYLPFVNVAISNTGLLFRSGVPIASFYGIISLIIELMLFSLVTIILVKQSSGTSELGDLMPVLEYIDSQKQKLMSDSEDYFASPALDKVERNTEFNKTTFSSLLKKELLLFDRSNDLKMNFLFILFTFPILLSICFFPGNLYSNYSSFFLIGTIAFIFFELDTIMKFFYSIKLNSELLHVYSFENMKVKFIVSFIVLIPFFIIFILKINGSFLVLGIMLYLIAELLIRYNLRNLFVIIVVSFIFGSILTITLTL
jgi:hypothetical protein